MDFFSDWARVSFGGIDKVFDVSAVFCEFTLGGNVIAIRWYAVIIALGFTLAALFGGRIAFTWRMDLNKMVDVLIYGIFGGIIGARAYYVIFRWDYYSQVPAEIFQIWKGGLAIYGGIIGGILAGYITCKVEKLNFLNLLDLIGMSLLIGQGIGRWGNYANQEAFGVFTGGNYGMMSEKVADYIAQHPESYGLQGVDDVYAYIAQNGLYVHPTFFYESMWCLVGFLLLYLILKKARRFSGQLFLCYGIWYGTGRAIFEGLRTDSLFIGNTSIRVSQLVSIVLVAVCAVLLVIFLIRDRRHHKPLEGVEVFPEGAPYYGKQLKAEKAVMDASRAVEIFKKVEESGDKEKLAKAKALVEEKTEAAKIAVAEAEAQRERRKKRHDFFHPIAAKKAAASETATTAGPAEDEKGEQNDG